MNPYKTVNTFTQVPSLAQIVSYCIFLAETIIFYVCVAPSYVYNQTYITMAVLYSISLGLLIISTLVSSLIDPSDSIMIQFRNGNRTKISSEIPQCLYCDYCRSYVHESSRHCRVCNRCVQNFDHHCMWINNCVGGKNYKSFAFMIISTWINLTLYMISVIILSSENVWQKFLGKIIVSWIVLVFVAILWFLLTNLIVLHIYLSCKGLTTYQFIMAQRQQKQTEQSRLKQQEIKKNLKHQLSQNNLNKQKTPATQVVVRASVQETAHKGNQEDQIVFGQKQLTQKSQGEVSLGVKHEQANDDDEDGDSIRISQFFMRNKSLKILVGDSQADRPIKSMRLDQNKNKSFNKKQFPNSKKKLQK